MPMVNIRMEMREFSITTPHYFELATIQKFLGFCRMSFKMTDLPEFQHVSAGAERSLDIAIVMHLIRLN